MLVCGPDGTQYDNECFARLDGVTVYSGCGLTGQDALIYFSGFLESNKSIQNTENFESK